MVKFINMKAMNDYMKACFADGVITDVVSFNVEDLCLGIHGEESKDYVVNASRKIAGTLILVSGAELAGFSVAKDNQRHYLLANVALVGEAITLAMRTSIKWD